jgi:hypothetical protein
MMRWREEKKKLLICPFINQERTSMNFNEIFSSRAAVAVAVLQNIMLLVMNCIILFPTYVDVIEFSFLSHITLYISLKVICCLITIRTDSNIQKNYHSWLPSTDRKYLLNKCKKWSRSLFAFMLFYFFSFVAMTRT